MQKPLLLTAETSVADGFALTIETACRDFEVLSALIRNEIGLTGDALMANRARGAIRMALAKSFLFYAERARRICEQGFRSLNIPAVERKSFLRDLKHVTKVRDVNEHGFDPKLGKRGKQSSPSIHLHEAEEAALDETALVILSAEKILMGPINLFDYYAPINNMRRIAGFGRPRDERASA